MKSVRSGRCLGALLFLGWSWTAPLLAGEPGSKHFLWKVQSQDSTVYLLGSIHAAQEDFYPLAEPIMDAFRDSQILVVEASLKEEQSGRLQDLMLAKAQSPERPLADWLTPDLYARLASECGRLGLPFPALESLQPWFVALQLTMTQLQFAGYDPGFGIDRFFLAQAASSGREIEELEGEIYQIELLSGFTPEEQALFMEYTLNGLAQMEASLAKLKEAWLRGDAEFILKDMIEKPLKEDPKLAPIYEKLFFQRNRNMAEKILSSLHSGKTSFVVVGAGHLVGPDGIVSLLTQSGYFAEQL